MVKLGGGGGVKVSLYLYIFVPLSYAKAIFCKTLIYRNLKSGIVYLPFQTIKHRTPDSMKEKENSTR